MRSVGVLVLSLGIAACGDGGALPGVPDLAGESGSDDAGGATADLDEGAPDLAPRPPDLLRLPDLVPPPVDPGLAGPFTTVTLSLAAPIAQNVTLSILVAGPSDDGKALSQKGAPYPTVILSPGFSIAAANYAPYAQRLASHGFLVVTQSYRSAGNHPQDRDDTVKLVDWLLNPTGNDAAKVAGRTDRGRIGAAGHSLGGKVTFLAAETDPRIIAAFGIDPVNSNPPFGGVGADALAALGGYRGATGFIGETTNSMGLGACAPAADNFQQFYARAASPTFATTFAAANHNDFLDQNGCVVCAICFGGNASKQRTLALAVKYATAFFRLHLVGDAAMESWLTGAEFGKDAAGGAVTQARK